MTAADKIAALPTLNLPLIAKDYALLAVMARLSLALEVLDKLTATVNALRWEAVRADAPLVVEAHKNARAVLEAMKELR